MKKNAFNPYDYLPPKRKEKKPRSTFKRVSGNVSHKRIEIVTRRIENERLDITTNYDDWFRIGFSLISELGEEGRDYFHRISRFYEKYDFDECDKQFNKCLQRDRNGDITIGTFFYYAKNAGVKIR